MPLGVNGKALMMSRNSFASIKYASPFASKYWNSSSDEGVCGFTSAGTARTFQSHAKALRKKNKRRWRALSASPSPYVGRSRLPSPETKINGFDYNRRGSKRPNSPEPEWKGSCRSRNPTAGSTSSRRESQRRVRKMVEMKRERLKRSIHDDTDSDSTEDVQNKIHISEDFLVNRMANMAIQETPQQPRSSKYANNISDTLSKLVQERLAITSNSNDNSILKRNENIINYDADDEGDFSNTSQLSSNSCSQDVDICDAGTQMDSILYSTYDMDVLPSATHLGMLDEAIVDDDCLIEDYYTLAGIPREAGDDFFYGE